MRRIAEAAHRICPVVVVPLQATDRILRLASEDDREES